MQPVFRLVKHDGLRPVDHVGGHLFAAVGGEAVHEYGVGLGFFQKPGIHLIALQEIVPALGLFARPGQGLIAAMIPLGEAELPRKSSATRL